MSWTKPKTNCKACDAKDALIAKLEKSEQIESPIGTVFLTQDDAAAYLRKSRVTFYRLRKRYAIPHFKHGGTLLFKREDLDAYLTGRAAILSSN